jgi:ubiquinone/menaquinone biosynthesis C-methylase UbiE
MENKIKESINANILVHTAMADVYNSSEPHFRPESINRVENVIKNIVKSNSIEKALDLGCGTGFMINILKKYSREIVGVDVTQAMMDKVDLSGNCKINLINHDTGTVSLQHNYYNIATAYSFIDHLYELEPTFRNAFLSLKTDGLFYCDLIPNHDFWKAIKNLDVTANYDNIINREINAVYFKDKEITTDFNLEEGTFTTAEFQKQVKGGLSDIELELLLYKVGFKKVDFFYHWFVGQGNLINDVTSLKEHNIKNAEVMHEYLEKALPLTKHLFKYIGFIAYK